MSLKALCNMKQDIKDLRRKIKEKYAEAYEKDGISSTKIAAETNTTPTQVLKILREQGVKIRERGRPRTRIDVPQPLLEAYTNAEISARHVAHQTKQPYDKVIKFLKQYRDPTRNYGSRLLTRCTRQHDPHTNEILKHYSDGHYTLKYTAEVLGVSKTRVYQLMIKANLVSPSKRRPVLQLKGSVGHWTARYRNGELNLQELADKLGVSPALTKRFLQSRGIQQTKKKPPPYHKKEHTKVVISPVDIEAYTRTYPKPATIQDLADRYNCSTATICNALNRQGIKKVRGPRYDAMVISDPDKIRLENRKVTITGLAAELKVAVQTIVHAMNRQHITIREGKIPI